MEQQKDLKQQLLEQLLETHQQVETLTSEVAQQQQELIQKNTQLEQLRGAFSALLVLAQQNGLVNEQGQVMVEGEPTEEATEEEVVEVVEAEQVTE